MNDNFILKKEFTIDYAHRLHEQQLDSTYSLGSACKCKNLHGHTARVVVNVKTNFMTNGMTIDYTNFKQFKKALEFYFDHVIILKATDPLAQLMDFTAVSDEFNVFDNLKYCTATESRVFVLQGVQPTSEVLSILIAKLARLTLPGNNGIQVEFHEGLTSSCVTPENYLEIPGIF